ncbi:MAG: type II toxin-antitoxin system RelE/ParE family toxin [Candidatus Dadabacteria bacterium]|nr:type II toxin-antitoxin system RelE/ParE family toxin [Candidatus Dadabacteria bacterium]
MLPSAEKKETLAYVRSGGKCPFQEWFDNLDTQTALKVETAIARIKEGNLSNVKSLGQGVSEYRLNFGPGYRIYFGIDCGRLVILLGGGTKKRQGKDIQIAKSLWKEYKSEDKKGVVRWH